MPEVDYKKFFDLNEVVKDIKAYMPDFNEKLFLEAFVFAEEAHRGQMRKDGKTPYIVHPVETVKNLMVLHAGQDSLITALLHDVPEDTKRSIKDVEKLFGKKVAFLVDGITKLSKVYYKHDMPGRQVRSLKKLLLHSGKDLRVIIIKLADRLHNIRTLKYVDAPEKRMRIARETLEIYTPIANLLGLHDMKLELEDTCFMYLMPSEYNELKTKLKTSQKKREKETKNFIKNLSQELKENKINADVFEFEKGIYRAYKKLCTQGKTIDDLKDRIPIRILIKNVPDCYRALGVLHSLYAPKPDRFKDYIAHPKNNGYMSIHAMVFGEDGYVTEVQILTEEMNEMNKSGIAIEYVRMGSAKKEFSIDDKRFAWLKEVLEIEKTHKKSVGFLEDIRSDVFQDRIFLFTPKGETIDLPRGASAIDFAYAIHSELGNHAMRAEINGKLKPITTVLRSRNVVSIVTSDESSPQLSWLPFIKTSLAKNKVLLQLRKSSRKDKIRKGHNLLQKEFDISRLGYCEKLNFKNLKKLLHRRVGENLNNLDDLFAAVGEGRIKALTVINSIRENSYRFPVLGRFMKKNSSPKKTFEIKMKLYTKNRFGLLREITNILYKKASDIVAISAHSLLFRKNAIINVRLTVDSLETVSKIFNEIAHVEGVYWVRRVSHRRIYWFYLIVSASILGLGSYPILLKHLNTINFEQTNQFARFLFVHLSFLLIYLLLVYSISLLKRTFAITRNKHLMWATAFALITTAIVVLFSEMSVYEKGVSSWDFIVTVLLSIVLYLYLFHSYKKAMMRT